MGPQWLVALVPLLAGGLIAAVPHRAAAVWINIGAATVALALACRLPWDIGVDRAAAHFAMLAAFVGAVAAWFEMGERQYLALFQVLLGLTLFSLLAKSPGVAWIGIEAGVIAGAVALGLPMTAAAVAAAWRYLVLCAVGLGLALFGTVALSIGGDGTLLNLGFTLVVIGYGAVVVLAPVQVWVPGVVQLPPLLAILRTRALVAGHGEALAPGPLLMVLGLGALLVAAFCVWREQDARRSFSCAGIGQAGVAVFAFGVGTAAAVFAGLLHLTLLTLTRAAALHCAERRGISRTAATVAMAGLPPFGLFASFFLILMATIEKNPWLAVPLGVGLALFAWAMIGKPRDGAADRGAVAPAWVLLAVAAVLGIAMPAPVVGWFSAVAAELQ